MAEVYRYALRAGGHPVVNVGLPAVREVAMKEGSDEQLGWVSPSDRALVESLDARLNIMSETNTRHLSGVDPKRQAIVGAAGRALYRERAARVNPGDDRWCLTLFPTDAYAQDADMSLGGLHRICLRSLLPQ